MERFEMSDAELLHSTSVAAGRVASKQGKGENGIIRKEIFWGQ
jgi:hypothetical protein